MGEKKDHPLKVREYPQASENTRRVSHAYTSWRINASSLQSIRVNS